MQDYDVIRNGKAIARSSQFTMCRRTRSINASDSFEIEDAIIPIKGGDILVWREDGVVTGYYMVDTPEHLMQPKRSSKATAQPMAPWLLVNTGWPGVAYSNITPVDDSAQSASVFMENVSFNSALDRVSSLVLALSPLGATLAFNRVNMPEDTTNIRVIDSDTALRALMMICQPSDARWRCRADLENPTIEIGTFGEIKPQEVHSLPLPAAATLWQSHRHIQTASTIHDYSDAINGVFVEGGSYTDASDKQRVLTTLRATAPAGFTQAMVQMPDGRYYILLTKDYDANRVPYTWRRTRRIHISGIAPAANMGDTGRSSDDEVVRASIALMKAGVRYLTLYAEGKSTWRVTIPSPFTSQALPGDRIYCTLNDEISGEQFSGALYVISHTTTWQQGAVASQLELSDVLDTLLDPLSMEYANIKNNSRKQ